SEIVLSGMESFPASVEIPDLDLVASGEARTDVSAFRNLNLHLNSDFLSVTIQDTPANQEEWNLSASAELDPRKLIRYGETLSDDLPPLPTINGDLSVSGSAVHTLEALSHAEFTMTW